MKQTLLFLSVIGILLTACSKEDDDIWSLLPDSNDIASGIDDALFKEYCYSHFDLNRDGVISREEAEAVTEIAIVSDYREITSLAGIEYFSNLEKLNCREKHYLTSADLRNNLKLKEFSFYFCYKLERVFLPNGVTEIEDQAFLKCNLLTHVSLPESITKIGASAFYDCSALESITIPKQVTEIENGAFASCKNLQSITIPKQITAIKDATFNGCTNLKKVTLSNGITSLEGRAFYGCSSLKSITIPDQVTTIGEEAFSESGLENITIPDNVTEIGGRAFYSCRDLTTVTLGNGIQTIGYQAFSYCDGLMAFKGKFASSDNRCLIIDYALEYFAPCELTSYIIPSHVMKIKNMAFFNCRSLESITIPNNVTEIEPYAFSKCVRMKSITLPDRIQTIGNGAFINCDRLKDIYCKPTTPPKLGQSVFDKTLVTIRVPTASTAIYKTANMWSDYAAQIAGFDFQ